MDIGQWAVTVRVKVTVTVTFTVTQRDTKATIRGVRGPLNHPDRTP